MSWDIAVWHTETELTDEEAASLYEALCNKDTSGVTASPGIDAFYAELTALHPEPDNIAEEKIDDHDLCPWSYGFDRSPAHLLMTCMTSKAEDVLDLVLKLAKKHDVAVYDPQSKIVINPDDNIGLPKERETVPGGEGFWGRMRRVIWSGW